MVGEGEALNLLTWPQIAIAKFFDGEGPDPVAEALAAQNVPPPRATRQENLQESLLYNSARARASPPQDLAPRIVPQPDDVIRRPPFLLSLLFTPFSILYRIFSGALGLFSYLFPFLPRALRPNTNSNVSRRNNTSGRRPLKPRDAAARLKREFEEDYGANSIPFFEGGYAQALDLAKKDLKFLLVVLLSPEHDDTSHFVHDTLLATSVQSYLNNPSNIILWVGDVRDSEAYEVSTALTCTKFPFTAVVAHNPRISSTAMSVIERITGSIDPSTYLAQLTRAISSHEESLAGVRASRSAQNFERNLRQEQDSAYERSLAADRERARVKREAEAEAAAAVRREQEAAEEASRLAEQKLQWRRWRASKIAAEPSADAGDVVRIALKMPEAARIMRRFRASDGIEELYSFVECYDILNDGGDASSSEASKPGDYDHAFAFRLVQTLPRVVYEVSEGKTIGEMIGKSGNLIVEPIHSEEDEDEDE